jgi:POTRA domain, ShlB-type
MLPCHVVRPYAAPACGAVRVSMVAIALGVMATAQAQEPAQSEAARFTVKAFQIRGATLVPQADLHAVLKPWLNKPITLLHLQQAARTMTELYRAQGWPLWRQVPTRDFADGIVTFEVTEEKLMDADKVDRHLAELAQRARQRVARSAEPALLLGALKGPDAGGLLREIRRDGERQQPAPEPGRVLPLPDEPNTDAGAATDASPRFQVKAFRL